MAGKRCGPGEVVFRYLPGSTGEDHDRTLRTAGVPVEIQTGHLHYKIPHSYRHTNLLQKKIFLLPWHSQKQKCYRT